jgi:hypothetical protein
MLFRNCISAYQQSQFFSSRQLLKALLIQIWITALLQLIAKEWNKKVAELWLRTFKMGLQHFRNSQWTHLGYSQHDTQPESWCVRVFLTWQWNHLVLIIWWWKVWMCWGRKPLLIVQFRPYESESGFEHVYSKIIFVFIDQERDGVGVFWSRCILPVRS